MCHRPSPESARQEPSQPPSGAPRRAILPRRQGVKASRAHARGQGMTEYIIIVALIAVAAIGVYTLFGQTLRNQTAGLAMELSGQDAATSIANANTNATAAQTNANTRKGLDNYNLSNRP